LSGESKLEDSR
jgi:hypothetical protein